MGAACSHVASVRPTIELADVLRVHGPAYARTHRLRPAERQAVRAIVQCRTAALGGRRASCPRCGYAEYRYHSCRNRHCPKCQSLSKAQWLDSRQRELLPTPYFHLVFTLPHELHGLVLYSERNRRALWGLLFQAASETLLAFGRNNLGGTLGLTLVLHTWDQQLRPHFHVHALATGGVLAADGSRWIDAGRKFLFPVRALSRVFRGKYLAGVAQLLAAGALDLPPQLATKLTQRQLLRKLRRKGWVVYCKPPFAGPEKLLDYLGRYTHRAAISNHRLLSLNEGQVTFAYRDRRDGDRRKSMPLPAQEFIGRFLKHVLPKGFVRVRHYGLLANRAKQANLEACRQLLGASPPEEEPRSAADWIALWTGHDVTRCPHCGHAELLQQEIPRTPRLRRGPLDDAFW